MLSKVTVSLWDTYIPDSFSLIAFTYSCFSSAVELSGTILPLKHRQLSPLNHALYASDKVT
jgi:hypothetical protein